MKEKHTIAKRISVALIIGASCAFTYVVLAFISMQLESALRSFWLVTLFDYKALIIFVASTLLSGYLIKTINKKTFAAALLAFIFSFTLWSIVADPPLSEWLLPPIKGK